MALDPRLYTALVTGSARRNGQAMALWLAGRGVRVAVHYRESRAEAEATLAQCEKLAPGCVLVQGDVAEAASARAVVDAAAAGLGGLSLLVNNVGNYLRKDLFDLTPAQWRDQVESNLYSAWWCTQAAVAHMREVGFGRIVNLGYAAGERPTFNRLTVPYHIAKAGVGMLTRSAGAALARSGITVNSIGVGIMENSVIKPQNPPAGRFAQYADLCHALGFFLAPESDHINGTQVDVCGGWVPEQIL
ncbi:MAG: SDR family oxidoreductase [Planctomycetes bacterium]|nr:SDR family oxidoreductase [Planctomycetota bacterium]